MRRFDRLLKSIRDYVGLSGTPIEEICLMCYISYGPLLLLEVDVYKYI